MNNTPPIAKGLIPTCNILGVNIAAVDIGCLITFSKEKIRELSGDYMCVSNVHTTVMSWENKEYCAIQNGGILAIPDGGPLVSVAHRRGCKEMQRITGYEYMAEIFKVSGKMGYRHFFYGSTEITLEKMKATFKQEYPDLQIVGMYSPPFRPLTKEEDDSVIECINSTHPDFVWVGLGAPKQEIWMSEHKGKINGFMVGVGAAFDYYAGNIRRAPKWMQKHNLEWFYRFLQAPRKMFDRYWHTNIRFIWYAIIKGK